MKIFLQISNIVAFVAMVLINYLSNTGIINNSTVGDVSKNLNTLFTPAGYAFAIWGVIYLLLLGFIIYQGRSLFVRVKDDDFILRTGGWFILSCIANSAWVFAWLYEYTALSVLCILVLLLSLIKIVLNNRMELWDAPLPVIAFLWWPFVVYSGWVTVASIANISAWLKKIEWSGLGLSEAFWAVSMIVVAGIINLLLTWTRNMREFALVGAWALIAIAVANWDVSPAVMYSALITAVILISSSGIHGYLNRATSPLRKLKT